MCRDSSDWAEKPKVIVGRSPLKDAPDMNGHEEQVRQQVLEGEPDGDEELERASRGDGVVEERLRHREVPDPVVHVGKAVEAVVVLVVVRQRVHSVWMCRISSRLWHSEANRGPGPLRWRPR